MENKEIEILIVEDEALIAHKIKMQLESYGYKIVEVCHHFEGAQIAIQKRNFDVLLTDINLGYGIEIKSGLQIAKELSQIKDCPIIFLTAFGDINTIKKASAVAPSAYLVKPINAESLFASVQLAVNNFLNANNSLLEKEEKPEYFFVKLGKKYLKIYWKDVYHLQAIKNYVKIITIEQPNGVLLSGSLQQIMQKMIPDSYKPFFVKINWAEVIAKHIVKAFDNTVIQTEYGNFLVSSGFDRKELGL